MKVAGRAVLRAASWVERKGGLSADRSAACLAGQRGSHWAVLWVDQRAARWAVLKVASKVGSKADSKAGLTAYQ